MNSKYFFVTFFTTIAISQILYRYVKITFYDFQQIKLKKLRTSRSKTKQLRKRPYISIVIFSDRKNHQYIDECIDCIIKSKYQKSEIIINNSANNVKSEPIKKVLQKYPKKNIVLVQKKRNSTWTDSINYLLKTHINGEILVTLKSDQMINSKSLKNIAFYFNYYQDYALSLDLNKYSPPDNGLFNLISSFKNVTDSAIKKSTNKKIQYSDFSNLIVGVDKECSKITNFTITKKVYSEDVFVIDKEKNTFRSSVKNLFYTKISKLSNLREPGIIKKFGTITDLLSLSAPGVIGFIALVAVIAKDPLLFAVGWIAMVIIVSFSIINNRVLAPKTKLELMFFVPVIYIVQTLFVTIDLVVGIFLVVYFACLKILKILSLNTKPRKPIIAARSIHDARLF